MVRSRIFLCLGASLLIAAACGGRSGTDTTDKAADLLSNQPAASKTKSRLRTPPQSVVSTIQGNVSSVPVALRPRRGEAPSLLALLHRLPLFASAAHAGTALEDIQVSIEGSGIHADTDVNGVFSVVGRYFGPTTLRFDREEDGLHAQISLSVPNGASLFLRDVTLEDSTGKATTAAEDLTFDGVVIEKECLRKEIQVTSRYDTGGQSYVVDLADSVVSDGSGKSLTCRQLRKGAEVLVQGLVQPDGSIGRSNVTVYDEDPADEAASSSADGMESASVTPASAPPPSPAP